MAEKGVVIRPSFYEAMKYLKDKEQAALFRAICEYGFYDKEPEGLNNTLYAFFLLIQPVLDAACKRYNASVANGAKAKKNTENVSCDDQDNLGEPSTDQSVQSGEPSCDQDTDTEKEKDIEKENLSCHHAGKPRREKIFVPPREDEVDAYCQETGIYVDSSRFVDYYTSIGWKVGKKPMRDWKAAVRSWYAKNKESIPDSKKPNCGYTLAPLEDPWDVEMERRYGCGQTAALEAGAWA